VAFTNAVTLIVVCATALFAFGCDIYNPPGEDHEVSGQVLWVDESSEDGSLAFDPPNADDCRKEGLNLHASQLKGTEREIIAGGSSIVGYPEPADDLALDRSAQKVYWAVHTEQEPPCGPVEDVTEIEQVGLTGGGARQVRKIDNTEASADRIIPALATAGVRLVWAEVAREGTGETSTILEVPLPAGPSNRERSPAGHGLRNGGDGGTEGTVEVLVAGPDGDAIYWNTQDNRHFRTDLGEAPSEEPLPEAATSRLLGDFDGRVEAVGGRPARIYWAEPRSSGTTLRSVALDGSGSRRDGTLPPETTAIGLGPKGEKIFAGTAGEDEGIWVGPLANAEASRFDKCVGEGKSGERHREDFQAPRSLAVLYDTPR
jgi:hypothetical protein